MMLYQKSKAYWVPDQLMATQVQKQLITRRALREEFDASYNQK